MSGSQRRRVTFADLVSARLPSAPPSDAENKSKEAESVSDEAAHTPPEEVGTSTDNSSAQVSSDASETPTEPSAVFVAPQGGVAEIGDSEPAVPGQEPAREGQELAPAEDSSARTSPSPDDSQSPHGWQSPAVRRTFRAPPARQNDCQTPDARQSPDDSQSPHDSQPLKEVKGYLRLPNTVVDSLLPTLDVYEQAAFIQLYRLSHGFGNYTCKISLPALQARAGLKTTSMKQAIARLQTRGIVEKLAAEIGFGREQGITYWVSPDGRQTYGDWQSSRGWQSPDDHNKRKALKETVLKGRLTPEQIKTCPDCHGVGMWYPEGPGKGVARCLHPSLRSKL